VTLLYYTHNVLPDELRDEVLERLNAAASRQKCERLAVVAKRINNPPAAGWQQIVQAANPAGGPTDQDSRILTGARAATTDYVALTEHDVLYPHTYLQTAPWAEIDRHLGWWYDVNTVRCNAGGYFGRRWLLTSCLVARTDLVARHFEARLEARARGVRIVWDEPGKDGIEDVGHVVGPLEYLGRDPVVDLRWGGNMTGCRTADAYSPANSYWGDLGPGLCRLWDRKLEEKKA
jgi:hypothetical protein